MPAQVVWSIRSLADLTAIIGWIAAENPSAAKRVGDELRLQTRQLENFPLSGRLYDRYAFGEVREIVVAPYRIFYRLTDDARTVRILRVWHAARGMPESTD